MDNKFILFTLLTLYACSLNAQNLANQKFKYITPQEGLSQSTVTAIYQDNEGFMWFGTLEGLNRYDGQNMVVYKMNDDDSTSITYNEIESLYEDSQGNFWVGTDGGGLNLYNRDTDSFISYEASAVYSRNSGKLSENTINVIREDSKGDFWVGTYYGLNKMDRKTGKFTHFFSNENDSSTLSNNNIVDVLEDSRGNFWVGTIRGLNLMNREKGTFKQFYAEPGKSGMLSHNYIEILFEDSKGILWVGTEQGLNYYDWDTGEFRSIGADIEGSEILNTSSILSLTEDSRGILWIGTENEGLFAINRQLNQTHHFKYSPQNQYGLNKNSIYDLYESRDNILWIGTFDGGLNLLERKKSDFEHYNQYPGKKYTLSSNSIYAFIEDHKGNFWIGTDGGGLNRFEQEKEQYFPIRHNPENKKGLSSDVIIAIAKDTDNYLWLGTYRGGLSRFNPVDKTFKHYKYEENNPTGINHNEIFEVYEDRNGTIWAGTNGRGLNKMLDEEKGTFKHYSNNPEDTTGITNDYIRDIYEDSKARFWIGTYGRGVALMDREAETFTDYNTYNGKLNSNIVQSIFEDHSGTLWVGTKGGGVAYYDETYDKFISYTEADGLANNVINGILEDDHGNLWLSSNEGVSKFNTKDRTVKNYGLQDGLQSREFKPNAAYKDGEGFMYFGGINGFNRFHPDSVGENLQVPPVVLTDFQVFNKSVPIGDNSPLKKHINYAEHIELPFTASVLTFKFATLNFNSGSGNTYAYRLVGFDENWNEVGSNNTATYTNLDPGEYTFEVKAANSDGYWGEQIKTVGLEITPPFWKTAWFYLLAGISIIGLVIGGFKYRTRQITQQNKVLEEEVAKRTAELRESNQDLKQALKDLQETREELVKNAHKAGMADIATGVLHNIGNVLNSVTTSTTLTGEVLEKSKLHMLFKANQLLREHKENLEEYLTKDPKGQQLTEYYLKLDESLKAELETLRNHNNRLDKKVNLINNVIAAQQNYAREGSSEEVSNIKLVIDDALTIYSNSLERHAISIHKEIEETVPVHVNKTKLVHVVLNILKNAKDALVEAGTKDKQVTIKLYQEGKQVCLEISDNGLGIKKENLNKIFTHGFTTKKTGYGFGLHSSANYMTEMGGTMKAQTNEKGEGAIFKLCLPAGKARTSAINITPFNMAKEEEL